jgi:hypothetical protein
MGLSLTKGLMDESCDDAVSALLLGYSALSKAQRAVFMDRLNQFMFVSPQQQRRIAGGWLDACQVSTHPAARVIAESAAVYAAESKKPRKAKGK